MHLPIDILLLLFLGPCLIRNPSFFNLSWFLCRLCGCSESCVQTFAWFGTE